MYFWGLLHKAWKAGKNLIHFIISRFSIIYIIIFYNTCELTIKKTQVLEWRIINSFLGHTKYGILRPEFHSVTQNNSRFWYVISCEWRNLKLPLLEVGLRLRS